MFPRSQPEVIPDSQSASSISGGNMGSKQGIDTNNVANILRQLSFEEINEDSEDNRSDNGHYRHSDLDGHNSDNVDSDDLTYYGSQLPQSQAHWEPAPIPADSVNTPLTETETGRVQLAGEVLFLLNYSIMTRHP